MCASATAAHHFMSENAKFLPLFCVSSTRLRQASSVVVQTLHGASDVPRQVATASSLGCSPTRRDCNSTLPCSQAIDHWNRARFGGCDFFAEWQRGVGPCGKHAGDASSAVVYDPSPVMALTGDRPPSSDADGVTTFAGDGDSRAATGPPSLLCTHTENGSGNGPLAADAAAAAQVAPPALGIRSGGRSGTSCSGSSVGSLCVTRESASVATRTRLPAARAASFLASSTRATASDAACAAANS
mmetsp:Transcript_33151/g.98669  ORF Transcript_33151/g.98669 Transcript_33151/m.98669 type:complete len:243 (+) Transcript_33151:212-940(+)